MTPKSSLALLASLFILTACGSSHRVTYSGHEESTDGVPGFKNGKRVSPNVKLGQSYTVDGETYVPRYQPDYTEEGMASWYGPGFHGGKTANGERFDKDDLTAAHRTLPLPSLVRVTMLSTGKQAVVRVNDRGPFSKGRIIDLSRRAAEQIGLVGAGVAKVRVEYMPAESQRFADLLAQGRDPKSIDIASEVLFHTDRQLAANSRPRSTSGMWDKLNPVSSAEAAEPMEDTSQQLSYDPEETVDAAPLSDISTNDLPMNELPPQPKAPASPFVAVAKPPAPASKPAPMVVASVTPKGVTVTPAAAKGGTYIQLGAFLQQANAEHLRQKYASAGPVSILPKPGADGTMLYRVRMGPFATAEESEAAIDRLSEMGVDAKMVRE